jgi:hypothetical protein
MAKIKGKNTIDPVLNEFVYTAIFKADMEQKRAVGPKYLKNVMTEKAARSFADKSSREEKEHVLAHMGYEFYYVINKSGKTLKHIKEFLPILTSKKTAKETIAEEGVFVTSDKETIRTLGLLARLTHSPTYYLDLEILRQGYHIKKWSKKYGGTKDLAFREADEYSRLICQFIENSILNAEHTKSTMECSRNSIIILLRIYRSLELELYEEKLKEVFKGRIGDKPYSDAIRELSDNNLILRIRGTISITSAGIIKVNEFFHKIIHSNNF